MTGVEILATQEVATAFAFNWLYFWIALFVSFIICAVIGCIATYIDGEVALIGIFVFVGFMLGSFLGCLVGWANEVPCEYETQYKVIISDEAPMNDFLDRYEIVDQDGKIYVVRERD